MPGPVRLDTLTAEDFAPAVGTEFALSLENSGESLTSVNLLSSTALRGGNPQGRPPFALLFEGPASPELPQQTYLLTHPALGELGVFLVPIGGDAEKRRYEAIFN